MIYRLTVVDLWMASGSVKKMALLVIMKLQQKTGAGVEEAIHFLVKKVGSLLDVFILKVFLHSHNLIRQHTYHSNLYY